MHMAQAGNMSIQGGRHMDQDPGGFAAFGPFRLVPAARRLERDGVPVELGGRALDILIALVSQAGKVVSKAELISSIWPDITVVEGVLRVHVCNLRKALGDGVKEPRFITSVAGRGYCFVAPVVRGEMNKMGASIAASVAPTGSTTWKPASGLPSRLARMAPRSSQRRSPRPSGCWSARTRRFRACKRSSRTSASS